VEVVNEASNGGNARGGLAKLPNSPSSEATERPFPLTDEANARDGKELRGSHKVSRGAVAAAMLSLLTFTGLSCGARPAHCLRGNELERDNVEEAVDQDE
jgi:hypothetical protein